MQYSFGNDVVRNNIRDQRKLLALSQQDLAENTGVTRQTIISIEKGKYTPSLPLAFKIAAAFDKSIEEVFEYEG